MISIYHRVYTSIARICRVESRVRHQHLFVFPEYPEIRKKLPMGMRDGLNQMLPNIFADLPSNI
jgi:hypothetical protein